MSTAKECLLACILAKIPDTVLKMPNLYPKYSCKLLFYSWIIWERSETEFPFKKKKFSYMPRTRKRLSMPHHYFKSIKTNNKTSNIIYVLIGLNLHTRTHTHTHTYIYIFKLEKTLIS